MMKYGKGKIPKSKPIKAGHPQQQLIAYAGMILAVYTPQNLLSLSKDATEQEIEENSADLFKYRWTPIAILPDGSIRFRCPQCAGKITTNAKTRAHYNPDGTPKKHLKKPNHTVPRVALVDDEYCCGGTVTIPVDRLDTYQKIPWGTPAWFARYTRRNQIENVNGMLQDRGGLQDGWCRVLNQTGNTLGLLVIAIAHNLRERKRYKPSPATKNGPPTASRHRTTTRPTLRNPRNSPGTTLTLPPTLHLSPPPGYPRPNRQTLTPNHFTVPRG